MFNPPDEQSFILDEFQFNMGQLLIKVGYFKGHSGSLGQVRNDVTCIAEDEKSFFARYKYILVIASLSFIWHYVTAKWIVKKTAH